MSKKNAKVAALVEGCRGQSLDAHYLAYFECFNGGLYFEAHDVLEHLWLAGRGGPNHGFFKGLIQLAGAFVHLQRNRLRPAAALFKLADTNLRKYPAVHEHLDMAAALELIADWQGRLEAGEFAVNPLTADTAPRLQLRPISVTTLIIATRNRHKVGEIRAMLGEGFRVLTLDDFPGAPAVVEDAPTFAGNATKKAVELAHWISSRGPSGSLPGENAFVLADDSGLEVDALGGAPGVHSARFAALDGKAAGNSSDADNNAKLLRLLAEVPAEKRTARFRCVLALTPVVRAGAGNASPVCAADEFELSTETFDGTCEGRIGFTPGGGGGFGYDPLFIPMGGTATFAELGEEIKNRSSHRARALAKLRARFHEAGLK